MSVRLEQLLAAGVGDDPWYHADYGEIRTKHPDEVRLIALAPDMARLLLDTEQFLVDGFSDPDLDGIQVEQARALLARLDALGKDTA